MSVESLQNSYSNCGFDEDLEVAIFTRPRSDHGEQGMPVLSTDDACQVDGSKQDASLQVKLDQKADRVRFFRRHQNYSEETSLLQEKGEVSVSCFIKVKQDHGHVSNQFKQRHVCVALSDCMHKVVYTSLIANFVLFSKTYLECSTVNSIVGTYAVVTCFTLLSAAFTFIRDVFPYKLPIILLGFISYLISLPILIWVTNSVTKGIAMQWWSILAIFLVCFGEAATRSALPEMGVASKAEKESSNQRNLVWKLHWIANLIILVATGFITAAGQNVHFDLAFYVSISAVVLSFGLFLIPIKQYKGAQIVHTGALQLVWNICKEAKQVKQRLQSERQGSTIVEEDSKTDNVLPESWIDFAKSSQGGTYETLEVDAVKCLHDISIIFLCLIPHWIFHAQCYSTYYYQGVHLDTRIGETNLPVAWLSLFSIACVMLLAPLFDMVIYPALESCNIGFPVTWRILSGLVFGCLSLILAGCVEIYGISNIKSKNSIVQTIGRLEITAANLSIFVQIPQYFFLALSEVLTALTALNVAYRLCSGGMKRLACGMYFLSISIGHIFALFIILLGWYPNQGYFADSSVQTYFFTLAALMLVNAVTLAIVIYRLVDIPSRLYS